MLGTLSALEALCDYALYKSTFTLHYITLQWGPKNFDDAGRWATILERGV